MVRFKNRYIVVEVNPLKVKENPKLVLKSHTLQTAILEQLEKLHGDFGLAAIRLGFTTKYCNEQTRIAYIRVRHGPHKFITSSLPLVTKVHRTAVTLRTVYTGASLKHCNKFLAKYQKNQLQRIWGNLKTEEEKNFMQNAYLKLRSS